MLESLSHSVIAFTQAHRDAGPAIVFALAFGESLAFVSLLVPATVILVAIGALAGAGEIALWPLILAGAAGAALGDWVSYAIGHLFKDRIGRLWPLNRNPQLLEKAHALFARYGIGAVFLGRFLGPLRATVPLAAGMTAMPAVPFAFANVLSALVWSALLLAPGALGLEWLKRI